jgi:hypothetical protein
MKGVLPGSEQTPDLAERFRREIRVHATLQHPNIAQLFTAFRRDHHLLMIMELVEGVVIGAAVMLVLNVLLLFVVVRPVVAMLAAADVISRGELGRRCIDGRFRLGVPFARATRIPALARPRRNRIALTDTVGMRERGLYRPLPVLVGSRSPSTLLARN